MGFRGASSWAGAGGSLDRAKVELPGFRDAFEPRQNITRGAHITGFFLNPHDLAGMGMPVEDRVTFRARQRVKLVEKENSGFRVFTSAAFGAQLVTDFSAGDQD